MMQNFVHLHVHSNYSFCRGANTIEQICAAAKEKGMTHIALTDTNGLYGLVWFLETAKRFGLTPLIGAHLKTDHNHCVLLAKNLKGYKFLCKAITNIHIADHPSLFHILAQRKKDVVVLTDDLDILSRFVSKNNLENIFAEIIPYRNREDVLQFARKHRIPPVAGNAVYFVEEKDWKIHRLLLTIDLNTSLQRVPLDELAEKEAFLKSREEMVRAFPDCPEAIINTQKIATECTFILDFYNFIFASVTGQHGETAASLLKKEVEKGLEWRYGTVNDKLRKRMNYEMSIIEAKKFAPYFLVVADVVRKAPRTCGRGSAAASLVSYALGITHVDPIKYDLFFERFLNPGRVDPPDIDVDFPWDERDDILDYIFHKYGKDCTAMISNHNSFKARSAVREIAKVYGIPDAEIGNITKKMSSYWQPDNLWNLTKTHPIYKRTDFPKPWEEIFSLAEKIRGFPRHLSVHCGGVVIAPDGLDNYVPTQEAKKILNPTGIIRDGSSGLPHDVNDNNHIRVVQWEKDQSEEMGLIKMDILGNRSLAVIRDALRAIEINYGVKIDYAKWNPLQDMETINLLARGDTIGVFYVESPAMRLLQKKTGKGDFEHLVIHSSIIRPAANVFISEYIRRLKGGTYTPLHPLLEEKLGETFGIMVYQEDVSKVVMALADFTSAEADDLRKILSKKHKQKQIQNYKKKFYVGAGKNHIAEDIIDKIWEMILSFSGYSFCKPHSASYAMVSFKSAYLRAHYPAEFMAAVISNQGGYYSAFAYISETRRMGIKVLLPDINKSEKHYAGKELQIRVGFMQLK
ncbi:MAG: PHP domain-containing protein, partial [Actinobacteria bacterium]|nr:PHP domain-containing protein [Actinomycetota bacterium]